MRAGAATRKRVSHLVRCVVAALAVILLLAPSAFASQRAPGGIGVRLLDAPASTSDDPRASLYIVDHLAPGTVIHRQIEISNTSSSVADVIVYPAAAAIEKGSFLGAAGHTPNDLSIWTSVTPSGFEIPARGRQTATVTITVPPDAAPGEQYAAVWAETRSTPGTGEGITQVSRVGIRIYLSVGPGGPPAADFTIESLTAERSPEGQPMVLASVHNTGGRALDMSGTLELLGGPGGLSAGPFPASLGTTLAIDATEPVTILLDEQIPSGPWDARITLHSGLLERSAEATITFPDAGVAPAVKTAPSRPEWLYPAIAGIAILLLVEAGTVLKRRRGSKRRRSAGSPKLKVRPDAAA